MTKIKLKDFLDMNNIKSGDNRGFVLMCEFGEMDVSRRYLECDSWKYLLECYIESIVSPYYNIYGQQTIKIILEYKNE